MPPTTPDIKTGWAVITGEPPTRRVVGMNKDKNQAQTLAIGLGPEFYIEHGTWRIGTSEFEPSNG
jgi:hypothetical protein